MYELEGKTLAGSETIVSRPKSAMRAWPVWSIRILALMGKLGEIKEWSQSSRTYPLEITVAHSLAMNVDEPSGDVPQLDPMLINFRRSRGTPNEQPTSSNRFTSGCALAKSLIFPFIIQSDTIAKRVSDIVTPISGSTFGCRRVFHVTTSLQNLCTVSVGASACGEKTRPLTHTDYLPYVTV